MHCEIKTRQAASGLYSSSNSIKGQLKGYLIEFANPEAGGVGWNGGECLRQFSNRLRQTHHTPDRSQQKHQTPHQTNKSETKNSTQPAWRPPHQTETHSSPLEGGRERERENACLAPTHVGRTGAHDGAARHGSSKTNRRAGQSDWCTRSGAVVSYLSTWILTRNDASQLKAAT